MPRPSLPKSGLTTTFSPRSAKARSAWSASCVTRVRRYRRRRHAADVTATGIYRSPSPVPAGEFTTKRSALLHSVQRVHAKNDLFQRGGRHRAHQDAIELVQANIPPRPPPARWDLEHGGERRESQRDEVHEAPARTTRQLAASRGRTNCRVIPGCQFAWIDESRGRLRSKAARTRSGSIRPI